MGLKTWNPNFCLEFSNRKIAECLFRRSVCFKNFSTQTNWNWVNGKPGKAPSSRFMIHTRCHTSIWAPFWHPRSLLSVLRSGRGGILPIMAYTERIRPNGVPFSGFRIWKGSEFTRCSIWKGREIGHFGLWKGRTDEFYGFIKSGKRSSLVIYSYLNDNAFTSS